MTRGGGGHGHRSFGIPVGTSSSLHILSMEDRVNM